MEFVFLSMGPVSGENPHGESREDGEWDVAPGVCLFLSGENSPNFQDPTVP